MSVGIGRAKVLELAGAGAASFSAPGAGSGSRPGRGADRAGSCGRDGRPNARRRPAPAGDAVERFGRLEEAGVNAGSSVAGSIARHGDDGALEDARHLRGGHRVADRVAITEMRQGRCRAIIVVAACRTEAGGRGGADEAVYAASEGTPGRSRRSARPIAARLGIRVTKKKVSSRRPSRSIDGRQPDRGHAGVLGRTQSSEDRRGEPDGAPAAASHPDPVLDPSGRCASRPRRSARFAGGSRSAIAGTAGTRRPCRPAGGDGSEHRQGEASAANHTRLRSRQLHRGVAPT